MLQIDMVAQRAVGLTEETVATWHSGDGIGKIIVVENLDLTNNLTYKFQRSSSSSGPWTDIAAFATIIPGVTEFFLLTHTDPFTRLRAYGNLNVSLLTLRSKSFTGNFSLAPL
jgi:hypothetical protein